MGRSGPLRFAELVESQSPQQGALWVMKHLHVLYAKAGICGYGASKHSILSRTMGSPSAQSRAGMLAPEEPGLWVAQLSEEINQRVTDYFPKCFFIL